MARRDQNGLTLVELLVVLTLIGLLVTLATPMASRALPGFELRTSAERLRSDLRLTRSAAIRQNRDAFMVFNVERGTYRRSDSDRVVALPGSLAMEITVARSEMADEGIGRIRFFPDGTSTGGAIHLAREGDARAIEVDWFDGSVTVRVPDEE